MRSTFTWRGTELEARIARARGRAVIGLGSGIVTFGKQNVDVISGDLMRSIHMAVPDTGGEVGVTQENVQRAGSALLEAGSWLDYACVEETGRMHQFMALRLCAPRRCEP